MIAIITRNILKKEKGFLKIWFTEIDNNIFISNINNKIGEKIFEELKNNGNDKLIIKLIEIKKDKCKIISFNKFDSSCSLKII